MGSLYSTLPFSTDSNELGVDAKFDDRAVLGRCEVRPAGPGVSSHKATNGFYAKSFSISSRLESGVEYEESDERRMIDVVVLSFDVIGDVE